MIIIIKFSEKFNTTTIESCGVLTDVYSDLTVTSI